MNDATMHFSTLDEWLENRGLNNNYSLQPLGGGDINDTAILNLTSGESFCLKQNRATPPDFFTAEATGLRALGNSGALRIPQVEAVGNDFLLLEYLPPGQPNHSFWEQLGAGLARLHQQPRQCFGFDEDNYCGLTPQPNPHYFDGHAFFREQRLLYQAQWAFEQKRLGREELRKVERLANRLEDLVPFQAPALIHGDLWSGNVYCIRGGEACIIDPAAYWGWPEAELAMTLLFGGFPEAFYQSYQTLRPLEPGWRERAAVYNSYHLLNHLNLFGGGYRGSLLSSIAPFVSSG